MAQRRFGRTTFAAAPALFRRLMALDLRRPTQTTALVSRGSALRRPDCSLSEGHWLERAAQFGPYAHPAAGCDRQAKRGGDRIATEESYFCRIGLYLISLTVTVARTSLRILHTHDDRGRSCIRKNAVKDDKDFDEMRGPQDRPCVIDIPRLRRFERPLCKIRKSTDMPSLVALSVGTEIPIEPYGPRELRR